MRISMLDQEFICGNDIMEVEQIFLQLTQWLSETGQHVAGMEIDGVEVAEDFERYIADHLNDIEMIIVNVKTLQELLADILRSVRAYLTRAIPEIDKLVDQFYHEVTPATWNAFSQLLEGFQFIINSLDALNQHSDWYFNARQFSIAKENLFQKIAMLQVAMESQDRVWLSDVLLYEIIPVFQSLSITIDAGLNSADVH